MENPVARGLRNLIRFSGRDTRGQFWPYAGTVFLLLFAGWAIFLGLSMSAMFEDMSAFAAAHPEATTVQSSPGRYSIQVDASHPDAPTPDLGRMFTAMWVLAGSAVALLAAAVSRRLQDRGMGGWWGLLPLPFLTTALVLFPTLITPVMEGGPDPDLRLFGLLFLNNFLYMVALVALIVLLARRGTDGPNRYGPAKTPSAGDASPADARRS